MNADERDAFRNLLDALNATNAALRAEMGRREKLEMDLAQTIKALHFVDARLRVQEAFLSIETGEPY